MSSMMMRSYSPPSPADYPPHPNGEGFYRHDGFGINNGQVCKRKAPIPRPWMSKLKHPSPSHQLALSPSTGINLSCDQTMVMVEDSRAAGAAMLLDPPRLTVDWGKLSSCFCVRGGGSSNKRLENHRNLNNSKKRNHNHPSSCINQSLQHGYKHKDGQRSNLPHNQFIPTGGGFPTLSGVIRRHSSLTLTSGVVGEAIEDCFLNYAEQRCPSNHHGRHHHHHDSGSISDFTQSETSSYLSFSDDDEDYEGGNIHALRPRIQEVGLNSRGLPSPPCPPEAPTIEVGRSAPVIPAPLIMSHGAGGASISNSTLSSTSGADKMSLPLARTPPGQRISRPPMIAARSRSAGLPPLNPSASYGGSGGNSSLLLSSQEQSFTHRKRADTGDFTRTSGTTNTSRHRRKDPFTFSDRSITDIWKGNSDGERSGRGGSGIPVPLPPSFVSFQQDPRRHEDNNHHSHDSPSSVEQMIISQQRRSSDVSALDLNEVCKSSFDTDDAQRMFGDLASDAGDVGENSDENSGSPFASLGRKLGKEKLQRRLPETRSLITPPTNDSSENHSPKVSSQPEHQQREPLPSQAGKKAKHMAGEEMRCHEGEETPIAGPLRGYLRKDPDLDASTKGKLILSGWVVVLFGIESKGGSIEKVKELVQEEHVFNSDNLYYLRVVILDGEASLLLNHSNHTDNSDFDLSYTIEQDWVVESKEVASHIGRAVTIRFPVPTTTMAKPSLLILPVALGEYFSIESRNFVSEDKVRLLRDPRFAAPGEFAPDEQLDSAMYLLFSIDSLVKQYGRK